MKTFLNGFETNEATFLTASVIEPGRAVALKTSGKLGYPAAGGDFTGIATACKNNVISVVVRGYAVASFKNTLPHVGICKLAPGETGYMEVDETNGKAYTVLNVDTGKNTVEFIL